MYVCPKCGNKDPRYFSYNKTIYCRKCITFNGKQAEDHKIQNKAICHLDFELSVDQKKISSSLKKAKEENRNAFLYAVTGAGKTELVYETILYCLNHNQQVGFVVPRKDVVIDLYPRIKSAFPSNSVIMVYGGHHDLLEGDIVLLTTHQLYRYEKYFDYLVFDEIDAFPYEDNALLESFFKKSLKGNYVMMSATPKKEKVDFVLNDNGLYLSLERRYHRVDLPLPQINLKIIGQVFELIKNLKSFHKQHLPCFVFVPTISEAEVLYNTIKLFCPYGTVVHSKKENREQIISDFKKGKYEYLLTTSILERGVTVKNLQVIVMHADHELYDDASLIQIAGRVGRKSDAPTGQVLFLAHKMTSSMSGALQKIKEANAWSSA